MKSTPFFTAPELSVIVPLLNEAENLPALYRRLSGVLGEMRRSFEIIVVDDGSVDRSPEILQNLAAGDPHVGVIRLARNYGQHGALMAGFRAARGNTIVTLDADLQNPPEEIPKLVNALGAGRELVCGVPRSRHDPWFTRLTSSMAHRLMQRAFRLPAGVRFSAFRALNRPLVDRMTAFTGSPVQLETLFSRCTGRIATVETRHAPRDHGQTKYTLARRVAFAMNLFTHLSRLPFRAAIGVGVGLSVIGAGGTLAAGYVALRGSASPGAFMLAVLALLGGMLLTLGGFLGECLAQVRDAVAQEPQYIIAQHSGAALTDDGDERAAMSVDGESDDGERMGFLHHEWQVPQKNCNARPALRRHARG
jgi:undecaprenyl-phosphate 4-deoxy-4-formamido-L-arabinose transferase